MEHLHEEADESNAADAAAAAAVGGTGSLFRVAQVKSRTRRNRASIDGVSLKDEAVIVSLLDKQQVAQVARAARAATREATAACGVGVRSPDR